MRICVVLPSEQQKAQAGVRIRYERITAQLQAGGHTLELVPITDFLVNIHLAYDCYLISKCYDARALLLAAQLRRAGKLVGVDLFDDYFSQADDSRFTRLRYWLRALLRNCSFVLCSTEGMRSVALQYAPDLPMHLMNDPSPGDDFAAMARALDQKLAAVRATRCIEVAWFGMGDNPNFPVGLADLSAFGAEVARLAGFGVAVHLTVLTNRRALTADRLEQLRGLGLPYTVQEWSEEAEQQLLARSLLAFLPVNAQQFSRVKSLNRAVTALSAGAQVLSAGYPLYAPLDAFVYRDARTFLADLARERLLLRAETVAQLQQHMQQLASVVNEAAGLAQFLAQLQGRAQGEDDSAYAVIHGRETTGDIHKFAQKRAALSVATPFCTLELNFDVRFAMSEAGLEAMVSTKKVALLAPAVAALLQPGKNLLTTEYKMLSVSRLKVQQAPVSGLLALNCPAADAAAYPAISTAIVDAMTAMFPGVECIFSEQSKRTPWHVPVPRVSGVAA
jgi:hypothetical protein